MGKKYVGQTPSADLDLITKKYSDDNSSSNSYNTSFASQKNLTDSDLTALTGTVDGSNKSFTVPESIYLKGTLEVYLNGVLQVLGDAITETSPSTGVFNFVTAPDTSDQVYVRYIKQSSGTTYTEITDAEINTGTASTSRTISGRRAQTIVNKAKTVTVTSTASAASLTPASTGEVYAYTALASNLTINAPTGATDGSKLMFRFRDDSTSRTLTWNAVFNGPMLPTATTVGKTHYIGVMYNSSTSKWDCIASVEV